MREMTQLLNSSKSRQELTLDGIYSILERSRINNQANGLTGILLYRNGEFVQLLEGEKLHVYYTLKKIVEDRRHMDVQVLAERKAERRISDKWSMAFKTEFDYNPELDAKLSELKLTGPAAGNLKLMQFLNTFFYQMAG